MSLSPQNFAAARAEYAGLHKEFAAAVAAYDRGDEIKAAAVREDSADDAKLHALRDKVREHEGRSECIADFKLLTALTAQLASEKTKVAADKAARRIKAEREASAAVQGVNFPQLYLRAERCISAAVIEALEPFCEDQTRAGGISLSVDALVAMGRWQNLLREIPHASVAQRLKPFLAGTKPLWKI